VVILARRKTEDGRRKYYPGLSSDFDGGGGVDGWNGADETFNVTLELVRRGYTEPQIAKIWSGNLLRVVDEVQAISGRVQRVH
jgi:membrane dipeptidase